MLIESASWLPLLSDMVDVLAGLGGGCGGVLQVVQIKPLALQ